MRFKTHEDDPAFGCGLGVILGLAGWGLIWAGYELVRHFLLRR